MSDTVIWTPDEAALACADDLILFGHTFFPKTFRQGSPDFHHDMGERLEADVRRNLFLVFRDGAKTTILRTFSAKRIAYGISRTIMYTSASQAHAIHSIRWLKRAITRNEAYAATFGLRPGSKWTDEWIQIINEPLGLEINVLAMGLTGQIRGFNIDDFRPDLIVADDILTEENTATEAQRKKTEELIVGGLENSLQARSEAPHAKIVMLQTPFNAQDSAMARSIDPAWHPAVYGCFDETGESRWPAKFSTAELLLERDSAIRRGNRRLWMREKECKIVKSEEITLNSDLVKYWDEIPPKLIKFITIDPASSDSKKADDNVVMAIGIRGPDVFVLGYRATKGTMPDRCAAYFFELAVMFAPILKAGSEGVAYQRVLQWYLEREMRSRGLFIPVEKIDDRRRKNDRIIQHVAPLIAYGHLHIHPSMVELTKQMDDFNPTSDDNADDILDALAMGIRLAGPLLQATFTLDGEVKLLGYEDESEYETLTCDGGAP